MRFVVLILLACLAGCSEETATFFGATIESLENVPSKVDLILTNTEAIRTEQGDKLRDIDAGVKDLVEELLPTNEPTQAVAQVPDFSFSDILETPVPFGVDSHCHLIRARAGNATASCTAVAVGDNELVTVAHLTSGLSRPTVEVQVGDQWRPASFRPRGGDLATVTIAGDVVLMPVKRRKAEYREVAYVYGLASKRVQRGLIVNADAVSLEAAETGTVNGDSGGGVFGSDGLLIGTLRSRHGDEKWLIYFEPSTPAAEGLKSAAPPAAAPAGNCPGGVCPAPAAMVAPTYRRFSRRK